MEVLPKPLKPSKLAWDKWWEETTNKLGNSLTIEFSFR